MRTIKRAPRTTLLDQYGRPMASTGYVTSGSVRRSMTGFNPAANSADTDILYKLESMRASARDLSMNAPIATGALNRFRANVVGYGLNLQCQIDRSFLGLSHDEAEEWERTTEREFRLWANNVECDASRTDDFYGLQALTYLSVLMSGDVFAIPVFIKRRGVPYDLRIRVLEADMVSNPHHQMDSEKLAGGVEVDKNGAPVKYWVSKRHPGGIGFVGNEWVGIPAYSPRTGMRQVLHIFDRQRPGQRRGVPLLAPVIETLKQATRLTEAELMAAVVSSFFTVFVKTETGEGMGDSISTEESAVNEMPESVTRNLQEAGSGSIIDLAENEEIQLADPKRPNSGYDAFFLSMVKQIGSAIGMPFEVLMLHFESSYSASRAALLEAWKVFLMHRTKLVKRGFCQPIYKMWLLDAVLKGRVKAPGFLNDIAIREAWNGSNWIGQGQGQLNPSVETEAAHKRVKYGFSTHAKEVAAIDGDDWDTMIERNFRERERIRQRISTGLEADPVMEDV